MIIDSKNYSGICSCGKEHRMETEFCITEKGCMKNIDGYIAKHNLSGYCAAIYDTNTYNAENLTRPKADKEIILPANPTTVVHMLQANPISNPVIASFITKIAYPRTVSYSNTGFTDME